MQNLQLYIMHHALVIMRYKLYIINYTLLTYDDLLYYLRFQLFVQCILYCSPSHHDLILERWRFQLHEQCAGIQVNPISLLRDGIA